MHAGSTAADISVVTLVSSLNVLKRPLAKYFSPYEARVVEICG